MMRMSIGTGRVPPTRSITRSWIARKQLGLQPHVHFGDFVEQQRAAVGLLEFADAPRDRAGEGALLVAEQLGFEQSFGNGGAIDADERLLGAVRSARARSAPELPCRCPTRR